MTKAGSQQRNRGFTALCYGLLAVLLIFMIPAAHALTLSDGLVAYYPFNGNASDQSGKGNHGTVHGGISYVNNGMVEKAVLFNGTDSYISVVSSASLKLSKFSITAWIKLDILMGGNRIVEKGNSNSYWLDINPNHRGVIGFYDSVSYHNLISKKSFVSGEWYFLAGTYDGTSLRIYTNGVLDNSMEIISVPYQTDEPLIIGWKYNGIPQDYFSGLIDEVRIYNRALSADEIRLLFKDDHGNSISQATKVAVDSRTAGKIEYAGDNDYFRLQVGTAGTLTVYTLGTTDTYGYLLNSQGMEFARNDDTSSTNPNFRITRSLSPGTYFVRARHFSSSGTGAYTLAADFTAANGKAQRAVLLLPGEVWSACEDDWEAVDFLEHGLLGFIDLYLGKPTIAFLAPDSSQIKAINPASAIANLPTWLSVVQLRYNGQYLGHLSTGYSAWDRPSLPQSFPQFSNRSRNYALCANATTCQLNENDPTVYGDGIVPLISQTIPGFVNAPITVSGGIYHINEPKQVQNIATALIRVEAWK